MFAWHMKSQELYDKIQSLTPEQRESLGDKLKEEYIRQVNRERPFKERVTYRVKQFRRWLLRMTMALGMLLDGLIDFVTLTHLKSEIVVMYIAFFVRLFIPSKRLSWKNRKKAYLGTLFQIAGRGFAKYQYEYLEWRKKAEDQLQKEQNDAFEDVARRFITS